MRSKSSYQKRLTNPGPLTEVGERLKTMDLFGVPIPQFNIKGKNRVKTHLGGVMSVITMGLTFMFAVLKFQHLMENRNPSITTFQQEIEANEGNGFSLANEGFMIAFGLDTYTEGPKNDERIVKWIARNRIKTAAGERMTHFIPVRNCTKADFA